MLTQMQKWKDKRVQHSPILLRAFCGQDTVLARTEGVRHWEPPSLGCAGGVQGRGRARLQRDSQPFTQTHLWLIFHPVGVIFLSFSLSMHLCMCIFSPERFDGRFHLSWAFIPK